MAAVLRGRLVKRTTALLSRPSPSLKRCLSNSSPLLSPTAIRAPISRGNVVSCPFEAATYPELNLYSHVFRDVSKHGPRVAIVDGVTGREYTFNEVDENTSKFSSALNRMGFSRGSVLSICSLNVPEYCSVFFGALASGGGTVSTVNPSYTAEELAYQFENSATDVIATVPAVLPTVQQAAEKAGVERIIVIGSEGESSGSGSKLMAYHRLLEDSGSLFSPAPVDAKEDAAVLPYSSGTSGLAKGVILTHHNVTANILQLEHPELLYLHEEGTTLLGVLPFFHAYGLFCVLFSSLYAGSKVVSLPKFEPELFLNAISKYRTDVVNIVPPLILFLAKHPMVDDYDLSCIRQITSGGAPLGRDFVQGIRGQLKCANIRQLYGLTEMGAVTVVPASLSKEKPQSIGVPVKSVEVKVVDPETKETLSAGEEGEVWIRGPNIMKGYLNLPDATKSCITDDGWFRSGDVGHFDEDGWFYITDRLKELIKVKGLQVAPAELEALLQTHQKIADAAVIGVAHERLGEAPRAYVVKKDSGLQEREVEEYVAGRVAKHKHLVGGVEFVDAIPKTASGKILRHLLRQAS